MYARVPGRARPLAGPDAFRFGADPDRRLAMRRLLAYQFGAYDTVESAQAYDAEQRRFAGVEKALNRSGGTDGQLDAGGLGARAKRAVLNGRVGAPERFGRPRVPRGAYGFGIAPVVFTGGQIAAHTLFHGSLDSRRQAQAANARDATLAGNQTAWEYLKGRAASMPDPKHGFVPAVNELALAGAVSQDGRLLVSPAWTEPGAVALFDRPGSPGFSTVPGGAGAGGYVPAPAQLPGAATGPAPFVPGLPSDWVSQAAQAAAAAYAAGQRPPALPALPPGSPGPAPGSTGGGFAAGSLLIPAVIVGGLLLATRR